FPPAARGLLYPRRSGASQLLELFWPWSSTRLDFFHLQEIQFHGRRSSEDRHHHLERVLVEIDLVDHAIEAGEGPFVDPHLLALFEQVLRLRLLRRRPHLLQNLLAFIFTE